MILGFILILLVASAAAKNLLYPSDLGSQDVGHSIFFGWRSNGQRHRLVLTADCNLPTFCEKTFGCFSASVKSFEEVNGVNGANFRFTRAYDNVCFKLYRGSRLVGWTNQFNIRSSPFPDPTSQISSSFYPAVKPVAVVEEDAQSGYPPILPFQHPTQDYGQASSNAGKGLNAAGKKPLKQRVNMGNYCRDRCSREFDDRYVYGGFPFGEPYDDCYDQCIYGGCSPDPNCNPYTETCCTNGGVASSGNDNYAQEQDYNSASGNDYNTRGQGYDSAYGYVRDSVYTGIHGADDYQPASYNSVPESPADVLASVQLYGSAGPRDLPDGEDPDSNSGAPKVMASDKAQDTIEDQYEDLYKEIIKYGGSLALKQANRFSSINKQFALETILAELYSKKYIFPIRSFRKNLNVFETPRLENEGVDNVEIVTQASFDRLHLIVDMCKAWNGPISIAIYVQKSDKNWKNDLIKFHIQTKDHCRMTTSLMHEPQQPFPDALSNLYPCNSLRNIALKQASAEFVFLLDGDFVPSEFLYENLLNVWIPRYNRGNDLDKTAILIAAFENMCKDVPVAKSQTELQSLYKKGDVIGFHMKHFPQGHIMTDYDYWFDANEPYVVKYTPQSEPYVIVKRSECPLYDERFFGYDLNKIQHLYHLFRVGFTFVALPGDKAQGGYVIHKWHPSSSAWASTWGPKKNPLLHVQTAGLYVRFVKELDRLYAKEKLSTGKPIDGEISCSIADFRAGNCRELCVSC